MAQFQKKYQFNISIPSKGMEKALIVVWHGRNGYLWIPGQGSSCHGHMNAREMTQLAKDWLKNRPKRKGKK